MSENETEDKKLSVSTKKTLTLRGGGVSQGTVRQNFSHGRSKSVVVETRKRRLSRPPEAKQPAATPAARETVPAETKPAAPATPAREPADQVAESLTE